MTFNLDIDHLYIDPNSDMCLYHDLYFEHAIGIDLEVDPNLEVVVNFDQNFEIIINLILN